MKGWMGKIKSILTIAMVALVLAGCGKENLTALAPKGYGAEKSLDLIIITTLIMTGVLVVVVILTAIVIMRFRRTKKNEDYIPKQVEGSQKLETIWTVIPIILVIIMLVPTIMITFDLADESEASDSLLIEVTGSQYWWHFEYPELEISTSQEVYIPTEEKVYLHIDSEDVIHSFWVPTISGKMDANPENTNVMYVEAYDEGVYWGKCAELCGPSHSLMDFKLIAVSPDDFDQWVADMQSVDPEEEPQDAVAAEGQDLFEENNCMSCHAIGSSPTAVGPNLTNFANRTVIAGYLEPTKENLVEWIQDPESLKPGNLMTGSYPDVSDEEADAIAEYLLQLDHSEITPETVGGLN